MSIDEQPMNVYWSGKRTETNNNFKTNYKGSVAAKSNLPSSGNKKGDMYNVTESGENFVWNGSSWDNLSGDTLKTLNWQKSEKAGAVTVYPVPGTALEPTVDFMFTETGPASGDKSPTNPSTISGVSEVKVTRCGKNVIPFPYSYGSRTINGVVFNVNSDGSISANGTASDRIVFWLNYDYGPIVLKKGVEYSFSGYPSGASNNDFSVGIELYDMDRNYEPGYYSTTAVPVRTFTLDKDCYCRPFIIVSLGAIVSNAVFKPQIEVGSTASSFERGEKTDYTIDLGNTCYGGSVDLSAGTMTVTWGSTVITGAEEWTRRSDSPSGLSTFNSDLGIPQNYMSSNLSASTRHCSHFVYSSTWSENAYTSWGIATNTLFTMSATDYPDVTAFKTWLASEYSAGHPVTIFYKLNTPQTVQLTPPQILALAQQDRYTPRLNTVYTDASAVQVGYAKSPIRSEYELTQAITAIE